MPMRRYTAADIGHVRLTGEAMIEICKKIAAKRAAWRKTLGVPQGFDIPDDPIPATAEACRAEMAVVEKLGDEAFRLRCSLPPGQERESAGAAMLYYRSRRINLFCAIRDGEVE